MFSDLMPDDHFGPRTSVVLVYFAMICAPLILFLVQRVFAMWHRRRGAKADASYDPTPFFAEGEAILHGYVEYEEGATAAVKATISQRGTEAKGKNGWNHSWKEIDRVVEVQPFYLVQASGKRVRIEPDEDVLLVDEMDVTRQSDRFLRTRTAQLTPGEVIFAIGDLAPGHDPQAANDYRGKSKVLVMRPPSRGKMLLSSEALGERFRKRASFHAGFSIATLVVTIFFQLFAIPYHVRGASGVKDEAKLVKKRTFTTRSKSGTTTHWELTIETNDGVEFTDEVSYSDYRMMDRGDQLPIIRVPWWEGRERVGHHVTIAIVLPIVFIVFFLILLAIYVAAVLGMRPWYEKKLNESGTGRLPDPS